MSTSLDVWRSGNELWLEGRVHDNKAHRHHALQVVWARGEPAVVETPAGQHAARTIVVDSYEEHALKVRDGTVCLVEARCRTAEAIRERWLLDGGIAAVNEPQVIGHEHDARSAALHRLAGTGAGVQALDTRIEAVLAWLDRLEEEQRWSEVSLEGALALVHLSKSRFLHLFSATVGSPWRKYLVWRRTLVAMTFALAGASLTRAAHEAGFSDAAHLTRQFKTLFGYVPSHAVAFSHFVQS